MGRGSRDYISDFLYYTTHSLPLFQPSSLGSKVSYHLPLPTNSLTSQPLIHLQTSLSHPTSNKVTSFPTTHPVPNPSNPLLHPSPLPSPQTALKQHSPFPTVQQQHVSDLQLFSAPQPSLHTLTPDAIPTPTIPSPPCDHQSQTLPSHHYSKQLL